MNTSNDKPHLVIDAEINSRAFDLHNLWRFRELLFFLTWRDIKVRYKQTALGATWAILQPLLTMLIFSIIFGRLANLPSEGIPYPIFTFAALLPWQLFAFALTNSSNSLVGNQQLVSKIYFPRIIIPIASILPGLADFLISFFILVVMMVVYQVPLSIRMFSLPVFLLLGLATAFAAGLWLSALNVQYRDIRHVTPFLTQVWLYATPVAYSATLIPEEWRLVYGLNPLTGVVGGFRWAVFGQGEIGELLGISTGIVIIMLVSGLWYFNRVQDYFADII